MYKIHSFWSTIKKINKSVSLKKKIDILKNKLEHQELRITNIMLWRKTKC